LDDFVEILSNNRQIYYKGFGFENQQGVIQKNSRADIIAVYNPVADLEALPLFLPATHWSFKLFFGLTIAAFIDW
jgi:hypothetical protein